jgi:hypothetical protein
VFPSNGRIHGQVVFLLHAAEYVALPDAMARRNALASAGCPDSLLDLADGTHLDVVEGSNPVATRAQK